MEADYVDGGIKHIRMKKEVKNLIKAWESLEGNKRYTPKEIEIWLVEKMKPAVDSLRETLITRPCDKK